VPQPNSQVRTVASVRDQILLDFGFTTEHLAIMARMTIVAAIIAGLAVVQLTLRVSIDQTTKDIRTYAAETRMSESWHSRLSLDMQARRSPGRLEEAAAAMGLVPATRVNVTIAGAAE
jgi:hypothetical protein